MKTALFSSVSFFLSQPQSISFMLLYAASFFALPLSFNTYSNLHPLFYYPLCPRPLCHHPLGHHLSVIILSVTILSVSILSVIILSVIILSVTCEISKFAPTTEAKNARPCDREFNISSKTKLPLVCTSIPFEAHEHSRALMDRNPRAFRLRSKNFIVLFSVRAALSFSAPVMVKQRIIK